MKKKVLYIIGLVCALIFSSCQRIESEAYKRMIEQENNILRVWEENSEDVLAEDLQNMNDVFLNKYKIEDFEVENMANPGGIAILGDIMLITDSSNDCIIKCSTDGTTLRRVGTTGSGPLEFLSPGAIIATNRNFYVLDAGNKRIQILDYELNFKDSIPLENNDPIYKPQSIAVNENEIYVSGLSFMDSVIDMYSIDGTHSKIGANFVGSIQESKGKVFAINSMSLFYDKENDSIGAVTTGPEYLLTIENGELKKECNLPCGFNIVDFAINDKNIIAVSRSAASVFLFDLDGNYVGTVANVSELRYEEAPQIECGENGELFLCMPTAGKVIKIYEQSE